MVITEIDPFRFSVRYNREDVIFNLLKLPQEPPKLFTLPPDETFVMRTFDESGYQFFLLFNEDRNYLFWVLNEEEPPRDFLEPIEDQPGLLVGRRSGFVFLIDEPNDDRKVLAAIRGANATLNHYYDGAFDQLADNYVDGTNVSEYLQRAAPTLRGRIDKYGYYTDRQGSSRVAASPYFVYFSDRELHRFMDGVRASDDPYQTISEKKPPQVPTPTP